MDSPKARGQPHQARASQRQPEPARAKASQSQPDTAGASHQKRQAARASQSGKAKSSNAKRAKGDKGSKQQPKTLPANLDGYEQKDVKLLMPENSFIWKNRSGGAWVSKVTGFGECARSVAKYGESKALALVIASAWHDWCLDQGIPLEQCPMQGLPQLEDE